MRYLFVGEEPSDRALAMGVSWVDGRLAAKQLFEALRANGIEPGDHAFDNWFVHANPARRFRDRVRRGLVLVAMGRRVEAAMREAKLPHIHIIHPAARGRIRKKEMYVEHIQQRLAVLPGGPGGHGGRPHE